MNVRELKVLLSAYDDEQEVFMSQDAEGNRFQGVFQVAYSTDPLVDVRQAGQPVVDEKPLIIWPDDRWLE